MKCPVCEDVQLSISSREGIEIDHCPQCRGVWLDRGELDKIIDRAAPAVMGAVQGAPGGPGGPGGPPPPDQGPPPPQQAPPPQQHDPRFAPNYTNTSGYGQPAPQQPGYQQGYQPPPPQQPQYDPRYDDRRYDPRYDDRRHHDDRGYDPRYGGGYKKKKKKGSFLEDIFDFD